MLSSALLFNPWVLSFMESLREESELSLFDDLGHGNHGVTNNISLLKSYSVRVCVCVCVCEIFFSVH